MINWPHHGSKLAFHCAIVLCAGLLTSGCSDRSKRVLHDAVIDAEIHASNCMVDVLSVPLEHSGNCLAAAKAFTKIDVDEVCGDAEWGVCSDIKKKNDFAYWVYWRAIAESLYVYGSPVEFDEKNGSSDDRVGGVLKYMRLDLLEQAFENCLAREKQSREIGMRTPFDSTEAEFILAISMASPLQEGQLCIREGYEDPIEEVG